MIDEMLVADLNARLTQHALLPRARDAAADALRHWYATAPQPLALDTLGLYPSTLALNLTTLALPVVETTLRIGRPDRHGIWLLDYVPVGTFTWRTTLEGQALDEILTMDLSDVHPDDTADDPAAPLPPHPYPVTAYGHTTMRAALYAPDPAAIPLSLVTDLAAALDGAARLQEAHESGQMMIAHHVVEEPEDYTGWAPATLELRTAAVCLVFMLAYDYPVRVQVTLDVLGRASDATTAPTVIGAYRLWTHLDGTIHDDDYQLWIQPAPRLLDPPPVLDVPTELLIDLGYLTPKRMATVGRLVAAVGEDGLRRLLAEARTRLAELALTNPPPSAPKSVRGMLWHMLQHDALDPTTRAAVLGLTQPRRDRPTGSSSRRRGRSGCDPSIG